MKDLKITIIQTSLHWENKEDNLAMFSEKIAAIVGQTDLIVLPEMFSTGFSMLPEKFSEKMNGKTVAWMTAKAKEKKCAITGSFICEDDGQYYNRLVWMHPDGSCQTYDKRHLFRMANEDDFYNGGEEKITVDLKGWKVCPLVCYDLRFPVWSRNELSKKSGKPVYDVLIYIANWPERRAHAWKTLLMARAIENQCYVVGVNRVGVDGNDINHSGDSAVINALGEQLSTTEALKEAVETVTISYPDLEKVRSSFPVLLDADDFTID